MLWRRAGAKRDAQRTQSPGAGKTEGGHHVGWLRVAGFAG